MSQYEQKWGAKSEPVPVTVYLEHWRIEGTLFRLPKLRVTDTINQAPAFIPLKDVTVFPLNSDTPAMTKPFLAVHKDHIVFVTEKGN
jgi:hypothetical protein